MPYTIKNNRALRQILWLDFILGGSTALVGILFSEPLTGFLGFSQQFILTVSIITGLYALLALRLALQTVISVRMLRLLILANWIWALISIGLLFFYFKPATIPGKIFLILQVLVVGGLAWFENKQLKHPVS
ncbi:hypothetical protein [Pseudobacter ginsenosidimutans]|nr:hypothetical protein [Pseudobacter ginsenosidimutans]QEC44302.1 hypothetical protein FSB84_22455 [Pseudobacter ginsenosidimutans]